MQLFHEKHAALEFLSIEKRILFTSQYFALGLCTVPFTILNAKCLMLNATVMEQLELCKL